MPPIIHLIRHGQGYHNVGLGCYTLSDPKLTPLGEEQCLDLQTTTFPPSSQSQISLIASSPLTRAIQSTYILFEPHLGAASQKILLLPDAQETSSDPCDTCSDIDTLTKTYEENNWPVDATLLTPGYTVKKVGGRYSPSSKAISRRAKAVRLLLREKARELIANGADSDMQIALVAHGGFMHYMTGDWEGADLRPGTGWVNCETRAYVFEDWEGGDQDLDARIVETSESRSKRGLEGPMIGWDEQKGLYEFAMRAWEEQGLENPSKFDEEEGDPEPDLVDKLAARIE